MNNESLKIVAAHPLTNNGTCTLPFAQSLISAGFPSPAENDMQNSLDLNELIIRHPAATFFVRVMGNSMIGAGIRSNDILVVDRAVTPTNNAIAVVRIQNEFTVKRIQFEPNSITLISENPNYPPRKLDGTDDCEIWGIVTFIIHEFKP